MEVSALAVLRKDTTDIDGLSTIVEVPDLPSETQEIQEKPENGSGEDSSCSTLDKILNAATKHDLNEANCVENTSVVEENVNAAGKNELSETTGGNKLAVDEEILNIGFGNNQDSAPQSNPHSYIADNTDGQNSAFAVQTDNSPSLTEGQRVYTGCPVVRSAGPHQGKFWIFGLEEHMAQAF